MSNSRSFRQRPRPAYPARRICDPHILRAGFFFAPPRQSSTKSLSLQHVNRTQHRERSRIRKQDTSAGVGNLLRAGQDRRQPPYFHQGGAHARRFARPRTAARPPGTGQDDPCQHHRQRNARAAARHIGSRAGQAGRPGRTADQPQPRRRAFHRRDTPPEPDRRGVPLLGDGGLQDRHRTRQRPFGTFDPDRAGAFHADRRHDPQRAAHIAPARTLWHPVPSGILRRPTRVFS